MSTATKKKQRRLIVSGFTRKSTQNLFTLYPHEMNEIISSYFWIEMLQWDIRDGISDKYQMVMNGEFEDNQIQSIQSNKDVVCIAKRQYVISSSIYKKFYFEIQLTDFSSAHSLDFVIGYVEYPLHDALVRNPRHFLGGGKGEHALYISAFNNYFEVYTNNRRVKSLKHKTIGTELKMNDRIGIEINFTLKKTLVRYNGSCIGIMADFLAYDQLIPAVSLFHKDITVACSQWKPIQYI
eukprot:122061_1